MLFPRVYVLASSTNFLDVGQNEKGMHVIYLNKTQKYQMGVEIATLHYQLLVYAKLIVFVLESAMRCLSNIIDPSVGTQHENIISSLLN